ncbi:MAG TPA: hypothetical protein VNN80_07435 [Polyangiaceae bacterium]|nr:hypothetical protein [Polyangiaceae bacterium]
MSKRFPNRWLGQHAPRIAVGGALCGLLTVAGAGGDEEHGYSDRSVAGTWSYVGSGGLLLPPAAPEPTPVATLGLFHFDGEGGCSAHGFVNVLGATVETETLECSYSVEPDGFGTAAATFTNAPLEDPFPFTFLIGDGGRELSMMNTEYAVGTLLAKRR